MFLVAIPFVILAIIPFLRLRKGRKLAVKRIVPLIITVLLIALVATLLADITIVETTASPEETDVVILVDMSESNAAMKDEMNEYIKSIHEAADEHTRIGLIVFADNTYKVSDIKEPEVKNDYLDFEDGEIEKSNTDIEEAITKSVELFKDQYVNKRVIIISDGRNTTQTNPWGAARTLYQKGITLDAKYFDIVDSNNKEVQITSLVAETKNDSSKEVNIRVEFMSTKDAIGDVLLYEVKETEDGKTEEKLIKKFEDVRFEENDTQALTYDGYVASGAGIHSMYAIVDLADDTIKQNNKLYSWFQIPGEAKMLIIDGDDGSKFTQADRIAEMIRQEGYEVDVLETSDFPETMEELLEYDQIALMNIDFTELPAKATDHIERYVSELGRGLFYSAGGHSYANSKFAENPIASILPIELKIEVIKEKVATVIAVDLSSSMGQSVGETKANGEQKTRYDMVLEGVIACIDQMNPEDYVGVVVFWGNAPSDPVVPLTEVAEKEWIKEQIETKFESYFYKHDSQGNRLTGGNPKDANGYTIGVQGTNYTNGINAGKKLLSETDAELRQFIFISDGEPADLNSGYDTTIKAMYRSGILTSTICIGNDSSNAINELRLLADYGGGSFRSVTTTLDLSGSLFEYVESVVGDYVNEKEFQPHIQSNESAIFQNVSVVNALPTLNGYYGTTVKEGAMMVISADDKHRPIVAEWQPTDTKGYVTVYMSDLSEQTDWSENWYDDPNTAILIKNIVMNSFVALEKAVDKSGLEIESERTGDKTTVTVEMVKRLRYIDDAKQEKLILEYIAPDGTVHTTDADGDELELAAVANKKYRITIDTPDQTGMYKITVKLVTNDGKNQLIDIAQSAVVGFYEDEYDVFNLDKNESIGEDLLINLARTGGGQMMDDAETFYANFKKPDFVEYKHSPVYWLIAAIIILFVLGIVFRHVKTRKQKQAEVMTDEEQILSMRGR